MPRTARAAVLGGEGSRPGIRPVPVAGPGSGEAFGALRAGRRLRGVVVVD